MHTMNAAPEPQPEIDRGLRSTRGIHWLLWVGALVVAVSTVRLVAVQWGNLVPSFKALILVAGALVIFAVGDLTRHRLRLTAAGSALLFLFTGLVPLLAWGAAYTDLPRQPFGWPALLIGFGALLAACQRLLRRVLRYPGRLYPAALGVMLLATPLLPWLQQLGGGTRSQLFFLTTSIALGLLLRGASRHVNRFFFHRDRRQGTDQPLHLLPFGLLALLYLLAVELVAPGLPSLAFPLLFLGIALVDTGEEYLRACAAVQGSMPQPWPRRTRSLLALGFSAMATAGALAFSGGLVHTVAPVMLFGGVRLLAWGWHYRRAVAHVTGALAVLVALPLLPSLMARLGLTVVTAVESWIYDLLGPLTGFVLGQLAVLGVLAAAGILLQRRGFPRRFQQAHTALAVVHGSWLCLLALSLEPAATLWLAPAAGLIALVALIGTRRPAWLLALYQFLLATGYAVSWLFELEIAPVLGGCSLLFLAAGLVAERRLAARLAEDGRSWRRWLALPPLFLAGILLLGTEPFLSVWEGLGTSNAVLLQVTGMVALAGFVLRNRNLLISAAVGLPLVTHVLAAEGDSIHAFALASHLPLLAFAGLERLARRRGLALVSPAATAGLGMSAVLGLLWLATTLYIGSSGWACLLLFSLGLILIDRDLLVLKGPAPHASSPWRAAGISALVLFPVVQLAAAELLTGAAALTLVAAGALLLLAGLHRTAPIGRFLARCYGPAAQAHLHRAFDNCLIVWQGAAAVICVTVSGPAAFVLAAALTATVGWRTRRARTAGWGPTLGVALLPLLQLVVLPAGTSLLLPELIARGLAVMPALALAALAWQLIAFACGRRGQAVPQSLVLTVDAALAAGYLAVSAHGVNLGTGATVLLMASAFGLAALHGARSLLRPGAIGAWPAQGWLLLICLQALTADWLRWEGAALGWLLAELATLDLALGAFLERRGPAGAARPPRYGSFAFASLAAWAALASTFGAAPNTALWLALFPAFLASLIFLGLSRQPEGNHHQLSISAAVASMGTFAIALHAALLRLPHVDPALYCLGPGLALLGLSRQLRSSLSPRGSRALFTTGAGLLYAMPMIGLLDEMGWGWQIVLLLLAVAFGATSFRLRSRSLLTVSTAALLIDLGFFLLKLHSTVPIALWVLGLAFGLGLMVLAAVLEHRRERLLQQLRVWGQEIRAWA